mmetsp:Transcript_22251/g.30949  ORF Transcript_22251/g.30949 Transcript_22251/m.30949 type:complete len:213 (-) Transcript_22251:45-683(-)
MATCGAQGQPPNGYPPMTSPVNCVPDSHPDHMNVPIGNPVPGPFGQHQSGLAPVMGAPVSSFALSAPQGVAVSHQDDIRNSHECYKCFCCPPTLQSMCIGQLILDIILFIIGCFAIFFSAAGLLIILGGTFGIIASSMIVCRCKCCQSMHSELNAYQALVFLQCSLSLTEVVIASFYSQVAIAIGAAFVFTFRASCIFAAHVTRQKLPGQVV